MKLLLTIIVAVAFLTFSIGAGAEPNSISNSHDGKPGDAGNGGGTSEDTADFEQPNPTNIFENGFRCAMKYAFQKGQTIRYTGTGEKARSIEKVVNPIEIQKVEMAPGRSAAWGEIGKILPEKTHLSQLKSSKEVCDEVKKMVDAKLGTKEVKENLANFEQPNPTEIFLKGIECAKEAAKGNGYDLSFKGTGELARSLEVVVNPIENQEISITKDGKTTAIGKILPEKNHLSTLKSSKEVCEEIKKMMKGGSGNSASKENLHDFNEANATKIFLSGFQKAEANAKSKGYSLRFEGTGELARSLEVVVNPIEMQQVYLTKNGREVKIGKILPEKTHLKTLHSSDEVSAIIGKMVSDFEKK